MALVLSPTQLRAIKEILDERRVQMAEHEPRPHHATSALWQVILTEEVGEVAAALHGDHRAWLRAALVQVAAVALAWLEALDSEGEPGRGPS